MKSICFAMLNRLVNQIHPKDKTLGEPVKKTFLEALEQFSNIILLGDPGSGKTHLFENAAPHENGRCITARKFSVLGKAIPKVESLFIDALDEHRSSHNDTQVLDNLVSTLAEVKPEKFRLSCRKADWLGSDLSLLEEYFHLSDQQEYAVIEIDPFSDAEIDYILKIKGIENKKDFKNTAKSKGVEFLLTNPQTLIMLIETVQKVRWPASKSELYQIATRLMVTEHNKCHQEKRSVFCSQDALIETTGKVCAALLLAGEDEISIGPQKDKATPHFTDLKNMDNEVAQMVLKSRAFITADIENKTVKYQHRTIAEYFAALWLASQVTQNRLPLSRILSLICVDGYPTSELRGLYAWLICLLSEKRSQLIPYDPYGILVYGDCQSFSVREKQILLNALVDLSESAPWFRGGSEASELSLQGLSTPDMEEPFKDILLSGNFQIQRLILDAILIGPQMPGLESILTILFCDPAKPFSLRYNAAQALPVVIEGGKGKLLALTRTLAFVKENIRLKYSVIASYYPLGFAPGDVIQVTQEYLKHQDIETVFGIWRFHKHIPTQDLPAILDGLSMLEKPKGIQRRHHVEELYKEILAKTLAEIPDLPPEKIWSWLSGFSRLCGQGYRKDHFESITAWVKSHSDIVLSIFWHGFETRKVSDGWHRFWWRFQSALYHAYNPEQLAESCFEYLDRDLVRHENRTDLFLILLNLITNLEPPNLPMIESLIALGNSDAELVDLFNDCRACKTESWRYEDAKTRHESKIEEQQNDEEHQRQFKENKDSIRQGGHIGWLCHLGKVYFGLFSDLDKDASPETNLAKIYGEKNVPLVLEGFRNFIKKGEIPSPEEVTSIHLEGKYSPTWYAVLAGLNEFFLDIPDPNDLPEDLLKTSLTILLYLNFELNNNGPGWKTALVEKEPQMVVDVYTKAILSQLDARAERIDGIGYLCDEDRLASYRGDAVKKILYKFPDLPKEIDRTLIQTGMLSLSSKDRVDLINYALAQNKVKDKARALWYSMALLFDFENYKGTIFRSFGDEESVLAQICSMVRWARGESSFHLTTKQLVFVIELLTPKYPQVPFESGSKDHEWDNWEISNFISSLIEIISGETTQEATQALEIFLVTESLESYRTTVLRLLAEHRTRCRQARYEQPSWSGTIGALFNGNPAHIPDLWAYTMDLLEEVQHTIRYGNTDPFQSFWDKGLKEPMLEEYCRDRLIEQLKPFFIPHEIRVEPEGHMAQDKRADIVLFHLTDKKLPLELKRDVHEDLWTACENQLDRMYTRDPEAQGYGIYVVFWFGPGRVRMPRTLKGIDRPQTPEDLRTALKSLIQPDDRYRLDVFVLDVTKPFPKVK